MILVLHLAPGASVSVVAAVVLVMETGVETGVETGGCLLSKGGRVRARLTRERLW